MVPDRAPMDYPTLTRTADLIEDGLARGVNATASRSSPAPLVLWCCLLAAYRESAAWVEEVQVAGIYPGFDPVAGPDVPRKRISRISCRHVNLGPQKAR